MYKSKENCNQVEPGQVILCFLTMKDVLAITKKSRSTIYRWIENGSFPEPVNIGGSSIAWPVEVIEEWREQINQSNSAKD